MFQHEYNVPLCNGTHCIQNVHPSYSNGNKRVLTVIVRGGLCSEIYLLYSWA